MEVIHSNLVGWGLGLRREHIPDILAADRGSLPVTWFEIITENYLGIGGKQCNEIAKIRSLYPMTFHGVSLSLGSIDPIDVNYLKALKSLAHVLQPTIISDHLSWTRYQNRTSFDLLPVPYTEESLAHIARRIDQVQSYLGRSICIENPSAYVAYKNRDYTEGQFLQEIVRRTGCGLILDINNLYVNQANLGFNAVETLLSINPSTIAYMHIAGHEIHPDLTDVRVDTHGVRVNSEVEELYKVALSVCGPTPIMLERDDNIPALEILCDEVRELKKLAREVSKEFRVEREELPLDLGVICRGLEPIHAAFFNLLDRKSFEISELVTQNGMASVASGIKVYHDAYHARLREALRGTFPCLAAVIGWEHFGTICNDYISLTQFSNFNIREIGRDLPEYLYKRHTNYLSSCENTLLGDVARAEWAFVNLYDAPDCTSWKSEEVLTEFSSEDISDLVFKFRPHQLLNLSFPVMPILDLFLEQGVIPPPPDQGHSYFLIVREDPSGEILRYKISGDEYLFFNGLSQGRPLYEAASSIPPEQVVSELLKLFRWGVITGVSVT